MGNFRKVFEADKKVGDSTAFLKKNRWYSALVAYHNLFLVPFLLFLKPKWCYQMEYA